MIQKRLLAEPKLNYAKAVETALNMKTAAQSVRDLKSKSDRYANNSPVQGQVQVHKTSANSTSGPSAVAVPTCYRCGNKGHAVFRCRVDKNLVCHQCGKRGHLQRACKSKNKGTCFRTQRKSRTVARIEDEEDEEEDELDSQLPNSRSISCQVHREFFPNQG